MTKDTFDKLDRLYQRIEKVRFDFETVICDAQTDDDDELLAAYKSLKASGEILGSYLDDKEATLNK